MILSDELKIEKFVSLAPFTTWRIGGSAEYLAEPKTVDELEDIMQWAHAEHIQCQIIGAGSNLLINDSKIEGLSICMKKLHGLKINKENGLIEAAAGEPIPNFCRQAAKAGLHGMEWGIGIPGTIGGAVVMNAGAQGGCIADCLSSIRVLSLTSKKIFNLKKEDLRYSYRTSILQKEPLIVLSAIFKLDPGHSSKKLYQLINQNLINRIKSQPYKLPSCGSVFRNPEPLKAGQLIEELGLKGYRIGDAAISEKHSNFIVNLGNAKAEHITALINLVQERVKEKYGFRLRTEVKQLGFDKRD